jgi:O-antigen/teichoic acid export membrane protein
MGGLGYWNNFLNFYLNFQLVEMDVARKVARNALYNSSALLVANLSGLFITVILARILRPDNFGIYSLALSIAMLSIAFSNLGIDGAVVRYTAFYVGNLKKVRAHLHYFFKIKIILASIVSLILILLSKNLALFFKDESLTYPFMLAGAIVFFASIANFLLSFFMGLQEFRYRFLKQFIYESFRWIFGVPLALMFFAVGALAGYSIAYFVSFLFLLYFAISNYKEYIVGERSEVDRESRKFVGFMTVAGVSGIIYAYVDSVMIGYFLGPTEVGFYRASYTIVFAIVGLTSSLAAVLFPTFTQMQNREITLALKRINKYTSMIAFPAALGVFYLSRELIMVVYGIDYLNSLPALTILAFALIPGAFNYMVVVFNSKERADISALVITSSMILNVLLNYILILAMGIAGAALATVISRLFLITAVVLLLWRVLEIKTDLSVSLKPVISASLMFVFLILLPKPASLLVGVAEVFMAMILYFALLFVMRGIESEDIRYFIKLFKF